MGRIEEVGKHFFTIIYLATDHAGFQMKEAIKKFLTEKDIKLKILGIDTGDNHPPPQ